MTIKKSISLKFKCFFLLNLLLLVFSTSLTANALIPSLFVADFEDPEITNVQHVPSSPTDADAITVSADVTDGSTITSVTCYYQVDSGSWLNQSLSLDTGSTYTCDLGSFDPGQVINYYINATDDYGNEGMEDNSGAYYSFTVGDSDLTAPTITNVQYTPSNPTDADTITVSADVTDGSGIASVTCYYREDSGSWQSQSLSLSTGSSYTCDIGSFDPGQTIEFYITAIDESLNSNEATDNNSGSHYSFLIGDSDIIVPTITNIQYSPSNPSDADNLTISCQVTDLSDIANVTLHHRIDAGNWQNSSMCLDSGSTYNCSIGFFAAGQELEFYITAIDNSLNSNEATDDNDGIYYSLLIGDSDVTAPTITNIQHSPSNPSDVDNVEISCEATDTSGITSVIVYYRIDTGSWQTKSMTLDTSSNYMCDIGSFAAGQTIDYYIRAIDNSLNANQATADNSGKYYSFTIENDTSGTDITPEETPVLITGMFLSLLSLSFVFKKKLKIDL